jgi:Mrp family chromosome partitioning ATPase/uncharacterized protein involved in exopolysaccharide biosynthesis
LPEPRAVGELIINAEVNNLGLSAAPAVSPWRKLANVLWRRRGVVGASIVAMVIIGGIYLLVAPQLLQTSATVRVHVLDQLLPDSAATGSNTLAEQPGIMRSTEVVALATASPDVSGLPLLQGNYGTIGAVQSKLAVSPGDQAGEFELSLTSSRPGDAEKLLNSIMVAYISLETAQRVQSSDALTSDLVEQQGKAAADLKTAKRRLNDAIKRRAELDADSDTRRVDADQRAEAAAGLADARQKADDARGIYERAIQFFGDEDKLKRAAEAISPMAAGSSNDVDPDVLADEILQLKRDIGQQDSRKNSGDARQLAQLSAEYASGVRDRYQSAIDRQSVAETRFDQLEKRTQDIDALDDETSRLQTEVDRQTSLDAELTDRLSHSAAGSDNPLAITIVKPAETGETPVWPRPLPVFGIAAMAGLLIGGGFAVALDKFDVRLRDPSDARTSAEAPLLGQLPASPSDALSLAERGQCVLLNPTDPCAASYRVLRRRLENVLPSGSDKTVLIASPAESRGTSVLASNLAISTARSGKRVVLVDARQSLRAINEIFGIEDRVGLSDVIAGKLKVTAALHVTGLDGLEVLPVGSAEEDWSEVLNQPGFYQALTDLSEQFDRVIIDGGSARSDECRIISAFCDATVVFADARKNSRVDLRAAALGLRAVGANIIGVVLKGSGRQPSSAELSMELGQIRGLWSRSGGAGRVSGDSRAVMNGNGERLKDKGIGGVRAETAPHQAPEEPEGLKII